MKSLPQSNQLPEKKSNSKFGLMHLPDVSSITEWANKPIADIVFNSTLPQVNDYVLNFDYKTARQLIEMELSTLLARLNMRITMNDMQVKMCAQNILNTYPFYKLPDIRKCFDGIVNGLYGKMLDLIDERIIMASISQYDKERTNIIIDHQIIKKDKEKQMMMDLVEVLPVLKEVEKNILDKKSPNIEKPMNISNAEIEQQFMKDFDVLYAEQYKQGRVHKTTIRFVYVDGKYLNLTDYLKHRFKTL